MLSSNFPRLRQAKYLTSALARLRRYCGWGPWAVMTWPEGFSTDSSLRGSSSPRSLPPCLLRRCWRDWRCRRPDGQMSHGTTPAIWRGCASSIQPAALERCSWRHTVRYSKTTWLRIVMLTASRSTRLWLNKSYSERTSSRPRFTSPQRRSQPCLRLSDSLRCSYTHSASVGPAGEPSSSARSTGCSRRKSSRHSRRRKSKSEPGAELEP